MKEVDVRSAELSERFAEALAAFRRVVEALTEEQWRLEGRNHPTIRVGDEDEHRPVGVVAFHSANSIGNQLRWVGQMASGEQPPPPDRGANARQAAEHAGVTKAEVLALLDENGSRMLAMIEGFSPEQLDRRAQTMVGEQSVEAVVRRVVAGHLDWHRGSIEATVGAPA